MFFRHYLFIFNPFDCISVYSFFSAAPGKSEPFYPRRKDRAGDLTDRPIDCTRPLTGQANKLRRIWVWRSVQETDHCCHKAEDKDGGVT